MSVRGKIVTAWATLIVGELVMLVGTAWGCWTVLHPPASVPVLPDVLAGGLFVGLTGSAVMGVAGVLGLRRLHAMGEEGKQ